MFEPFQKFVKRAAGHYGVSKEVEAAQVCHDFRTLIPEIFAGKEMPQDYIEAGHFKENILMVKVENQGWAQEVIMRKTKIIEEMNKKAGKEIIKNLRTQLR